MTREDAINYLKCSAFSDEAIKEIIKALEPKTTNPPDSDFNSEWYDIGKKVGLKEGYDIGHKDGYDMGFHDAMIKVCNFCDDRVEEIEERG